MSAHQPELPFHDPQPLGELTSALELLQIAHNRWSATCRLLNRDPNPAARFMAHALRTARAEVQSLKDAAP